MNSSNSEKPPIFKHWRAWYWLVLGVLAVQIIFYFWLTALFA